MRSVDVFGGYVAYVSDDDYEKVIQYKWHIQKARKNLYAVSNIRIGKKTVTIKMHRLIMGCITGDGNIVDHKDGNGLNCQKDNLRFSTISQNGMNCRKRENTTSKYKGVYLERRTGKWVARIGGNSNRITIGTFVEEKEAAMAFNAESIKLYGEFAKINKL